MSAKDKKVLAAVQDIMETRMTTIIEISRKLAELTKEHGLKVAQMLEVKSEVDNCISFYLARLTGAIHYDEIEKALGDMDNYGAVFTDILNQLLNHDEDTEDETLSDIPF